MTVTEREVRGTGFEVALKPMTPVLETGVWDESEWDNFVWGEDDNVARAGLGDILRVLSNGSFPNQQDRADLTVGERKQLRDAMILEAHARDGRDIFVTEDTRAFIAHGKRGRLKAMTGTRIFTTAEVLKEFGE